MYLGLGIRAAMAGATSVPSIALSSVGVDENSPLSTTVGAVVPTRASNPGAVSITAQEFANLFVINADGITLALGSGYAAANYEVNPTAWATFEYTDDNGTYQFTRTISITDVADGPTITGAATDLETMIGAAVTGTLVTGDLNDLFISPTSQTMTFVVSHGSVAGDGFTWSWTPSAGGLTTVQVTATDEDGQSLQIEWDVDVIVANSAPVAANVTLEFVVPEGDAPLVSSSSPTDNATGVGLATSPTVTFDRDIYFAATGTITLYNVTGAAAAEVFDLATDVGTGDGTVSISGDTLTINPTSSLSASTEYAIQWSAGAVTNFGGVGVAALTDTTTISFTSTSGSDVTAPTLSAPVDAANGGTASTGSVDTDEANGTLYWVVTTSATSPSAAQVKAGNDHTGSVAADSGSQAVSGTGTQALSPAPSGLTSETTYYTHFMHEDAAANQSTVSSADGFTTADVTAPTLSSPTDAANGSTAATASVSTNEASGTLYWVISTSATAPSAAQVKLGQMHTGAAAADSGSQAVSGTGVQNLSPAPSGLTASTTYYAHFMHEDTSTNQSTVASGDGFTTAASGGLAGYTTPETVFKSSATTNSYSGTVTGVTTGDYVVVTLNLLGNNTAHVSANYVVTLDGNAMTKISASPDTSIVMPMSAVYAIKATSTGNLALVVDLIVSARSCSARASLITGENATPVANSGGGAQLASDVSTFTNPSGITPAAGQVMIGTVGIKSGTVTGLGLTGGTALGQDNTGTNATSDHTFDDGYFLATDTTAISFQWDWTDADRVSAAWVLLAEA